MGLGFGVGAGMHGLGVVVDRLPPVLFAEHELPLLAVHPLPPPAPQEPPLEPPLEHEFPVWLPLPPPVLHEPPWGPLALHEFPSWASTIRAVPTSTMRDIAIRTRRRNLTPCSVPQSEGRPPSEPDLRLYAPLTQNSPIFTRS